jgi:hypothetical protein
MWPRKIPLRCRAALRERDQQGQLRQILRGHYGDLLRVFTARPKLHDLISKVFDGRRVHRCTYHTGILDRCHASGGGLKEWVRHGRVLLDGWWAVELEISHQDFLAVQQLEITYYGSHPLGNDQISLTPSPVSYIWSLSSYTADPRLDTKGGPHRLWVNET